ncbi:Bug family tripartite tricarboxylate transporter substrate binding protein [Variovorax sp. V116]|uniref:Bug family tripartite tricarboxylate transporter substrate binding protein n=1 Tax=Variovorax sp. V116 TaxID=3065953 RepID=UPI0034E8D8F7
MPSPPGGGLDPVARALAQELGSIWKQAVVVENRTGASGLIGTTAILNAPPDGHTLLLVNESIVVGNRFAFKKLPYDPDRSFTLLTRLVESEDVRELQLREHRRLKKAADAAGIKPQLEPHSGPKPGRRQRHEHLESQRQERQCRRRRRRRHPTAVGAARRAAAHRH